MLKVKTLMCLKRHAAYLVTTFVTPFKVSRKAILHFAEQSKYPDISLRFRGSYRNMT